MSDRYIGEPVNVEDVVGLIDPSTDKIYTTLVNVTALAEYKGTGNQAAMLASGAGVLDWFVRSDLSNQIWACVVLPSTVLGNWTPAVSLSSATPSPLGVAAAGDSTLASPSNHVHAMPSAADVGADPAGSAAAAQAAAIAASAPIGAKYLVATANGSLTDEVNLGALTTGLPKMTVAAGTATISTAVAGVDYEIPGVFYDTKTAVSSYPHTVLAAQSYLRCTGAGGGIVLEAAPVASRVLKIKNRASGDLTTSGANIDGAATMTIPPGSFRTLTWNGTDYDSE